MIMKRVGLQLEKKTYTGKCQSQTEKDVNIE